MYDHFPAITASWYTQWREVVKRRRHEETEWKRNTDNRKPEVRYRSDTSVGERKVAVLILQSVPPFLGKNHFIHYKSILNCKIYKLYKTNKVKQHS